MAGGEIKRMGSLVGGGVTKVVETADGDAIQLVALAVEDASGDPVARGKVTQTQVVNVSSVPASYSASGTATNAITQALVGQTGGYVIIDRASDVANITVSVTFGASINADPDVLIISAIDDGAGGLDWDHSSAPLAQFSVPRTASTEVQKTVRVAASGVKALQVILKNNDSTNALGAVKAWIREVA